ncbi:MAG TPA: Gfo/Idh/MocA family oxidoreductase [Candidatus Acidoferrum sp.]|jgi:UDP-2-acetamido-3-amino-2,3-dideoxy-glucuronate N-acetyltransferase|nr:Gfo/Idh/MocA family oxidoreductase [Candidatus Acidoferrum sp.]
MDPRIAVLGCGYWGKNLVRNFHDLGALEMVCDPAEAGRITASRIAPGVTVAGTFETALESPAVSAIAISAPAALHYPLAKAALEAGKDVYVEKPLCLRVDEAAQVVQLAEKLGKVLMVGHLLQYHPCVLALQSLLAQGELGKLHYIISNRLNMGKIRREENALWSFAPHDISVILSLANGQMPDRVHCTGGDYLHQGVADTTMTTLRFPTGIRAHVFVSWLNPFKEQKLTVIGSAGIAVFDDTKAWAEKLVIYRQYMTWANGQVPTPNKVQGEPVAAPEAEPLKEECQHFIGCCASRRAPRTDGREGLRVLSILQAAQRSLDSDGHAVNPSRAADADGSAASSSPPASGAQYASHSTAVVDEGATIGKGTKIWHFSHVMKGAKIGEGCVLGQNVNVDGGTVIGNNVKIQNNVSIYTGTVIEDDVFLGPSCVLTNVTNPRAEINRHSLYEGTILKRGCTIGANATIVCGVTIGRYAFIAAGSVVTKDVCDYALVMGNPARQAGWMSRHGHRLGTLDGEGEMRCPESGYRYKEVKPGVLKCLDLKEEAELPLELKKGSKPYRALKIPSLAASTK